MKPVGQLSSQAACYGVATAVAGCLRRSQFGVVQPVPRDADHDAPVAKAQARADGPRVVGPSAATAWLS
jgi:hypothetical protein